MDMTTALAELGVTAATLHAEVTERLDLHGYAALPDVLSGGRWRQCGRGWPTCWPPRESGPASRCIRRGALTGSLILSIRAPCSRPVSRIPGCWPALPMCWASSSSPRSTAAPRCRGRAIRACTPTGASLCRPAATRYATRSGCSTISPPVTAPPEWCQVRTDPARCRAWRCRIRPPPTPMRCRSPAGPGTVVIFNSHLWHGGTQNLSDRPRRALHSYFTRRGDQQQLDQKKYIRPQTLARLSPAALFILDV